MNSVASQHRGSSANAFKPRTRLRRPSVLHVLEATSAGAARYVADVLLNIDTEAFEVCFAYSSIRSDERFRDDLNKVRSRGIKTYEIPMTREINAVADGQAFLRLRRLMRRGQFDLVHAHSSKAGFLARLAARSVSRRMLTIYSPHAICISIKPQYRHLERFAALFTDAMLGVSQTERDELEQWKLVPREKLRFVTAAVDLSAYQEGPDSSLRELFGLPPDAVLVGTAGRLSQQKDPFTFLDVANIVLATEPNAYFVWIGDGELREQTTERARIMGIRDRLILPGYSANIKPWLASLDIFLLTSLYESFGYVTCEAMALGKPVVATRVAGSAELVSSGQTGFLGSPSSAESLAAYVTLLIRDEELRLKMGRAGRRKAEAMYSLDRMIADLESLYWDLLEARAQNT
jgi:glycosyltransferase involved in cell wall biosynthesis